MNDFEQSIISNCDAFFRIDLIQNTYQTIKASGLLADFIPDHGKLEELYWKLNLSADTDISLKNVWASFTQLALDKHSFYSRRTIIHYGDCSEAFQFSFFPSPDMKQAFAALSQPAKLIREELLYLENKKALNNLHLYSMTVDLDCDTCSDMYITEMGLFGQDLPQINYSLWRSNLLPCFSQEDQPLFLKMTDPSSIREQLTKSHSSITFDIRMQTLTHGFIWTRHILYRIVNHTSKHLQFLYTVEDINEERMMTPLQIKQSEKGLLSDSMTKTYTLQNMMERISEASRQLKEDDSCCVICVLLRFPQTPLGSSRPGMDEKTILRLSAFLKDNLPAGCSIAPTKLNSFICLCPGMNLTDAKKTASDLIKKYQYTTAPDSSTFVLHVIVTSMKPDESPKQLFWHMNHLITLSQGEKGNCLIAEDDFTLENTAKNSDIILNQVENDIRQNYPQKLTLKQLADKYFINSAYLGQLFIKRHHMTFNEYLWKERLIQAAYQLACTDKYIYEIIDDVGISNTTCFNRQFTELFGTSPAQYRKREREKADE